MAKPKQPSKEEKQAAIKRFNDSLDEFDQLMEKHRMRGYGLVAGMKRPNTDFVTYCGCIEATSQIELGRLSTAFCDEVVRQIHEFEAQGGSVTGNFPNFSFQPQMGEA